MLGVMLVAAAGGYLSIRRHDVLAGEFAALAREFETIEPERILIGRVTQIPSYIAPTDEVVWRGANTRRLVLRARALESHQRKGRELSL